MTEWYSPKDELPKAINYMPPSMSVDVLGVWAANVPMHDRHDKYAVCFFNYQRKSWNSPHGRSYSSAPTYWCYLPEISQELIDKLEKE